MTRRTITPAEVEPGFLGRKRVRADKSQASLSSHGNLSACETEFLKRLAQGDSYKEIATGMDVSINTVRDYVRAVYKKLDVNSRTKAVVKYLGANLKSA
jgi:DNA-binding NarL/FixJ family response regulator